VSEKVRISFDSKVKKIDKVDGTDKDKTEWIKLNFFIDPDKLASRYSRHLTIFKDG
jgi:hypothetical protein